MDRIGGKFQSHREAGESDRDYYRKLLPQERLDLLLELVARARTDSRLDVARSGAGGPAASTSGLEKCALRVGYADDVR